MHLEDLVQCRKKNFGDDVKLALDMARFLDGPLLDLRGCLPKDGRTSLAKARLELFERLSALFVNAGLPPLPLEPLTLDALATVAANDDVTRRAGEIVCAIDTALGQAVDPPTGNGTAEDWEIAKAIEIALAQADGRAGKDDIARDCESLGRVIRMMPSLMSPWGGPRPESLLAMANKLLIELGREPVRPDHSAIVPTGAMDRNPPPRPLHVLVVDDEIGMIMTTLSAMFGWPNLSFGAIHVASEGDRDPELQALAAGIICAKPDIVLMDQGMWPMTGSSVIREVRTRPEAAGIVFVGNTGGSPDELEDAGAIGNCNKGKDLSPLLQAFRRF